MNILVLGNGFDLAHGLPTRYRDFVRFADCFMEYKSARAIEKEIVCKDNKSKQFIDFLAELFDEKDGNSTLNSIVNELSSLLENNSWFDYFHDEKIKENWTDFESEISKIICILDQIRQRAEISLKRGEDYEDLTGYEQNILKAIHLGVTYCITIEEIDSIKNRLIMDLNRLTRCLEIYLSLYIESIEVEKRLPDIIKLPLIDKIISFNYTSTYENLYTNNPYVEYDYIHGKAKIENTVGSNNMVLGIDEYLTDNARKENIEFIEFKKYYQRIHKETGCLYRNWVDGMNDKEAIYEAGVFYNKEGKIVKGDRLIYSHEVYFFGHSLDVTDKDIIRELILADRVKAVVFYRDKADYGRKIINLVQIIGPDELIRRTGGRDKIIEFRKIKEAIEI